MAKIRIEIEERDLMELLMITSDLPDDAPAAMLRLHNTLTDKLNRINQHNAYTAKLQQNKK